jgi:uncharacterized phage protein (TIGR01671 family)
MREIKFRGKRIDTGQWITGGYVEWSDIRCNKYYQIVSSAGYHNDVIPDTVGQFTGLKDRNSKDIYEDDITRHYNFRSFEEIHKMKNLYQVLWGKYDASYGLYFINQGKPYDAYIISPKINLYGSKSINHAGTAEQFEVVGNIHDNPELLTDNNQ